MGGSFAPEPAPLANIIARKGVAGWRGGFGFQLAMTMAANSLEGMTQ